MRPSRLLEIKNLCLGFPGRKGTYTEVLKHLDISVRPGELLGIIGNSGSGKSMTALAVTGLLPREAIITEGEILFDGEDLLKMKPRSRRALLGNDIGIVFQEPRTALDPLMRVGRNLEEILTVHGVKDKEERRSKIISMLSRVNFDDPEDIYDRFPHQLSGGQRQRILIAGAALLSPKLLICDEVTSALDTVTTVEVLDLLRSLCIEMKITILFISHDLSAVENFCDRVMVMNDGHIIDCDNTYDILHTPRNEFTAQLLENAKLNPHSLNLVTADCDYSASPVMTGRSLSVGYGKKTIISSMDVDIFPREILGLIGCSGCGKTTLAKAICGLLPYQGEINIKGGRPGTVFQDPVSCLNPSHTVLWHMKEALRASGRSKDKASDMELIDKVLVEVGLESRPLNRYPNELSGGQRQRVAIGMCLIAEPELIVADEPFSSLDATSAAEILKLLAKINRERGVAILLISHNLHIIRALCKRVIIMNRGSESETGMTSEILKSPSSIAGKALLEAERKLHGM
ncbi:peptide/nickel transport system ATP-binding protein [Ruminococcaceae bacterium YRB3002]|nr:peptide/nickel transport system ATP-binding protein [Ruminococcaceae bacterium YRB3002]